MRKMPLLSAALLIGTTAAVCALFRLPEATAMPSIFEDQETSSASTPTAHALLSPHIYAQHNALSMLHWGQTKSWLITVHYRDSSGHTETSDFHFQDTLVLPEAQHAVDTHWGPPPPPWR